MKKLNVASVFSGIGAFEQALKQLDINHKVIFACDNGERELKFSLADLGGMSDSLDNDSKKAFCDFLIKANKLEQKDVTTDSLMDTLNGGSSAGVRGKLQLSYEAIMLLTQGLTDADREAFVDRLYEKTLQPNHVRESYRSNYHISPDDWHEDIRFLDAKKYRGKIDVIMGGSPCQSFSTYGLKRGLDDTRGTLFYYYARLIKEIRPKVFIYENVKGLLAHDKGRTWQIMKDVWNSLDYDIYYQVLNAKDFNLPQMRRRLFVVGISKDLKINGFKFPDPEPLTSMSTDFLEKEVPVAYYLPEKGYKWTTDVGRNQNKARINRDVIGCQTAVQQFNWSGDFRLEEAKQEHIDDPRVYVHDDGKRLSVVRKLMPIECLRLMGFKDFKIVVDDKVMYRQSGNSVAVPVIKALLNEITDQILSK